MATRTFVDSPSIDSWNIGCQIHGNKEMHMLCEFIFFLHTLLDNTNVNGLQCGFKCVLLFAEISIIPFPLQN